MPVTGWDVGRATRASARAVTCIVAAVLAFASFAPADAASRIKDLANMEGVRDNQLIGYGLVVGLNGTGDTINNSPFTKQSITAMLERLGVNIRGQTSPRKRRRRNGHGEPAGVLDPGHAHRRHRLRPRRFQEPAGRHAPGDAAPRRRRQRLCGRPGLARDRRLSGAGRGGEHHPRRADRRPHRQRGDHRARDRVRAQQPAQRFASHCATPTSRRRSASPPPSTIFLVLRRPNRSILRRWR